MAHNNSAHLADVKRKLAEKYVHLSKLAGSKPRRERLARRAENYRRQAVDIEAANA